MKQWFRDTKDILSEVITGEIAIGCMVFFGLFIVLLLLLLTPQFHNLWIKGFRSSNEYNTTKISVLYQYKQDYEKLDAEIAEYNPDNPSDLKVITAKKAQQIAILDRIEKEMGLMEPSQVPAEIKYFVKENK